METYIAILRGINVSGQKLIKMADLKSVLESSGFRNVITYIQSGNIIFKSEEKKEDKLVLMMQKVILEQFGFEVPVIIRKPKDIGEIIASNPFLKENGIPAERLYVTFLSGLPETGKKQELEKFSSGQDRFVILGKEVFLHCPDGYGNTKLSNTFFENKLKVTATTRNWATVNKLAELSSVI